MTDTIKDELIGSLAYTISVDGKVMEIVSEDDPFEYLHGYENIVPGLEDALAGKKVGDSFDVLVAPEDGFGEYDKDAIIEVDRDEYDEEDDDPQIGTEVEMMDDDGEFFDGTITAVSDTHITVDMNHPLAGKSVHYKGKVTGIREATEEELEWGFPETTLNEMFGEDEFDDELDA